MKIEGDFFFHLRQICQPVKQCSNGLQDYIYLDENCQRFFLHLRQIFFHLRQIHMYSVKWCSDVL